MLSGLMMLRAGKQKGLAGLNETKKKVSNLTSV